MTAHRLVAIAAVMGALVVARAEQGLPARTVRAPVWTPAGVTLAPESLAARLDGVAGRVVEVIGPDSDLMLLVVLDVAGDLALVEPARAAVTSGIAALPSNHFAAVLSTMNGLRVVAAPTADRAAAGAAIQSVAVGGRAGFLNTVETAARLGDSVLAGSSVRVAVLYITDSDIENYREDYTNPVVNSSDGGDLSRRFSEALVRDRIAALTARLAGTQTPVFTVHLNYRTDRLNEAYQTGLLTLSQTTGGDARFCRTPADIGPAIGEMVERIRGHYSVKVELPAGAGERVNLLLEGAQAGGIRYRSSFATGVRLEQRE